MFFNTLCFVWTILKVSGLSHGHLEEVDARSAGNYCTHGLATYADFRSKLANLNVLKSGHSGWLSGLAEWSHVLSMESCFNTTDVGIKSKIIDDSRENILGECIKYCNDSRYDYIGLKNNSCFCVKHSKLAILKNGIRRLVCQRTCQTTFNFNCKKYLVIYRKTTKHNYQGVGQCVYIYKSSQSEGNVRYSTASCHAVNGIFTHGFICHCEIQYNKQSQPTNFFVENVTAPSWTEAYNSCASKNCSLVGMAYSNEFSSLIPCCNKKYWTGGFRAISPVSDSSSNTCLAVTKVESNYFLDVDDCSTVKYPICLSHSPYITSTTFLTSTEALIKLEKQSKGTNQVSVAVGLTLGILAAMVIIVCVTARCIKSRTSSANKTLLTHENDYTVSGTEEYAVIDGEQSAIKAECQQRETFMKDTKNKPIKPERLTLRRQKRSIQAYENFQLVPVEDKKTSEARLQDDQYDRVDLSRSNYQNNEIVPFEADLHVYNHTLCDDENYDVTLPRQKTSFANEDYDTTQLEDVKLYNTSDMASIVIDVDRLNTIKAVKDSNRVSSGDKSDYLYVDDDQITLDDCTNNSSMHVCSEMDYDVVDHETTNTRSVKEKNDIVYEVVHRDYKNVDL